MAEGESEEGSIQTASVEQLIRAVEETESYAFLIGAGTSKSAGIPTSGELIEQWRKECYDDCDPEQELTDWVRNEEADNMAENQSRYGYWFERLHKTPGERRQRIQELVEGIDTTPGHIILASLMSEEGEQNYVPVTLTPNFDDLLFDAFYLYLEHRPQLINHRAVAPEFKLTRDDPAIVKLHGDYLYNNLHNTDKETESLEESMETAVSQTVGEYGIVVLGYGGNDESIMSALQEAEFSEYGLYWCVMEPDEGEAIENKLSSEAQTLLKETESYVVPISGFVSLMLKFEQEVVDVSIPERDELKDRADERRDRINEMIEQFREKAEDEEDEAILDRMQLHSEAVDAHRDEEYKKAIEKYNQAVELGLQEPEIYYNRAASKKQLEKYEEAIQDLNQAIEINPEDPDFYNKRADCKSEIGEYKEAVEDYSKAIEKGSDNLVSYNNRGNAKYELGEYESAIEDYNKAIEIEPQNSGVYNNRGNARSELGEYESAIEDYNKAIEIDPEEPRYYVNRGISKYNSGDYEGAIEDYNKAIDIDSENPLALNHLAEIQIDLGELEQAESTAAKAREISTSVAHRAESLLFYLIASVLLGEGIESEEEQYKNLCEQDFTTTWGFREIDNWLEDSDIDSEKEEKISELIELLRDHKQNPE
jgi:tetratricopeptide (TPR) repeat protein/NAD-dependent SIR2 family protein deacetylase